MRFLWVHSTYYFIEGRKDIHKLSLFASRPGVMINPHWLELPVSRTDFQDPKDVWAIQKKVFQEFLSSLKFYCDVFDKLRRALAIFQNE